MRPAVPAVRPRAELCWLPITRLLMLTNMTKTELLERMAADLASADVKPGWHLVLGLVPVEWEPEAWRLVYSLSSYAAAAESGKPKVGPVALGWLTAVPGPSEPLCWPSLDSATEAALAIRQAGLGTCRSDERRGAETDRLRVVVV